MAALRNVGSPERGVVFLDRDMKITHANRRAAQIFGRAAGELIGDDLPGVVKRPASGAEEVVEEVLESAFGQDTVFHRYSGPVYSTGGAAAGRVEIYSDITARRQLEKEILDRNSELAELNTRLEEAQEQLVQSERLRALGEMAAGIAHDINNVLGIVLGNAQLARRKLPPDSGALECVDAIELAAKDAAETVRRLREIGKPVDRSTYTSVDLREVIEDVVRAAVPAWRESGSHGPGVSIQTDIQPGCSVLGNPAELREAFANILLNAVHAIDEAGGIEIAARTDGEYALLVVRDTGSGMNEETRLRLFDPFFTTRGAEGSGLGMSMVDAIVIRHRGRTIVESEKGRGTTITLKLPLDVGGVSDPDLRRRRLSGSETPPTDEIEGSIAG